MKRIFYSLFLLVSLISCEKFLDESPPIGLSSDKLTDIASMNALINGTYANLRSFTAYTSMITSTIVHDVNIRRDPNWIPFTRWSETGLPPVFTTNLYGDGFAALNKINTVANANVPEMIATQTEKNSVLGDMHFLRALVYFDMNNYFTLNSSGNSVPLVLDVLGVNDRVSVAKSSEIRTQIEEDIELARLYFENSAGVSNYEIATALAARIYFFHEKYDLAYQRANEVVESSKYSLESEVTAPFVTGNGSPEVIFSILFNAAEGWPGAARVNFESYQDDKERGIASLNPSSLLAQLRNADPNDKRHSDLYTEAGGLVYANGKFPSNQTDYIYLRYSEILLTRAEANIMRNNGAINVQDIEDVNAVKNRAGATDTITGSPDSSFMLEAIYQERSKELAFEHGDRFLNIRRLQKGIYNEDGTEEIPFSEYVNQLVFPFPLFEVELHDLQR
ncbi:RagB/SusD family nutrient uptake outer membrane protein [Flagellimonas marinaquae]|uniref:RagB/SusD family nutrient uptake outer membrane protein n=1 Tax=Flagellimonas marinaquae TaxID=254955 RepID=UPI000F8DD341|nr:RagB/SusD family nutrient uptake outer membrane protein [Allomuricauda aquimarina]